jgi:multiple sugar transport system substrate-binding protein
MKKVKKIMILNMVVVFIVSMLFFGTSCKEEVAEEEEVVAEEEEVVAEEEEEVAEEAETVKEFNIMGDNLKYDPNIPVIDGRDVTLKIWVPSAWESFYRELADQYMEYHPNVKFEWTITSFDDHWKKVPMALQSNSGPDLFWMHNSQNTVVLPNMEPLPENLFPMEQLKNDFRNVESNVIDGKLYYTDMGLMTGVIFYNTDMWEAANLTDSDIPHTWDQLTAVAKKLTQKDSNGNITVAGFNMNDAEYIWWDMLYQQGKWFFDSTGEVAKFNSPEALKAAQLMYDLYHKDHVGDGLQPKSQEAFPNAKAAMIYCWGWASNYFKSSFPDLNYSAFKLPVFDINNIPAYGRTNGDVSLGVSKNSSADSKEAALNFVLFQFCNNDMLLKYDVFDGMAPSKRVLDSSPEIQTEPVLKVETEIINKVIWPGPFPESVSNNIQKYIGQSILVNKTDPAKALEEADQMVNKDLEGVDFISVESKYLNADAMSYQ